jgi:hypothetical protein
VKAVVARGGSVGVEDAVRTLDEAAGAFTSLRQPDEHCKILLRP